MKKLIQQFPQQLSEAIAIGRANKINFENTTFNQVLLSGLGGSGIGGTIVQDYMNDKLSIPFAVNKNYAIPKSVQKNTLFIACSYSGNTEETIQAVQEAKKRKAIIVCITSGGLLADFAKKNKYPCIVIPAGMPPRACLGYSLVQILYILYYANLLNVSFEKELLSAIELVKKETKAIQKQAQTIASKLLNKLIAIYSVVGNEGLAIRFRQQLNENSKVLTWHNITPEMTHNEIVGWKTAHDELAIILCSNASDYERNIERMRILKTVIKKYSNNIIEIKTKGENFWERSFYFIHLTDWVSVFLADLNGADAIEVKVIDFLKGTMAKK